LYLSHSLRVLFSTCELVGCTKSRQNLRRNDEKVHFDRRSCAGSTGTCFLSQLKNRVAQNAARDILPLQLEEQIPVPSVAGRIDHFSADAKRKRLFVSALGNNSLEVIDVFAGRVVHSIKGLAQPQGPLYVPAVDKLYVANAEDGKVRVYDGATYTLRKTIDFGKDPDNMRYDEASKRVYVGFGEDDGGIGMIDPKTDERVGDVYKTEGHPESFQVEAKGEHIFANVPDAGNVVESIDKKPEP